MFNIKELLTQIDTLTKTIATCTDDAKRQEAIDQRKNLFDQLAKAVSSVAREYSIDDLNKYVGSFKEQQKKALDAIDQQVNASAIKDKNAYYEKVLSFYEAVEKIPTTVIKNANATAVAFIDLKNQLQKETASVEAWTAPIAEFEQHVKAAQAALEKVATVEAKLAAIESDIQQTQQNLHAKEVRLSQAQAALDAETKKSVVTKLWSKLGKKTSKTPTPPAPQDGEKYDIHLTARLKHEALQNQETSAFDLFTSVAEKEMKADVTALQTRTTELTADLSSLAEQKSNLQQQRSELRIVAQAHQIEGEKSAQSLFKTIWVYDTKIKIFNPESREALAHQEGRDTLARIESKRKAYTASHRALLTELDTQISQTRQVFSNNPANTTIVKQHLDNLEVLRGWLGNPSDAFDSKDAKILTTIVNTIESNSQIVASVRAAMNPTQDGKPAIKIAENPTTQPKENKMVESDWETMFKKQMKINQDLQTRLDSLEKTLSGSSVKQEKTTIDELNSINRDIIKLKKEFASILDKHVFIGAKYTTPREVNLQDVSDFFRAYTATQDSRPIVDQNMYVQSRHGLMPKFIRYFDVDDYGQVTEKFITVNDASKELSSEPATDHLQRLCVNISALEIRRKRIVTSNNLSAYVIDNFVEPASMTKKDDYVIPNKGNTVSKSLSLLLQEIVYDFNKNYTSDFKINNKILESNANTLRTYDPIEGHSKIFMQDIYNRHIVAQLMTIAQDLDLPDGTTINQFLHFLENYAKKNEHNELKSILQKFKEKDYLHKANDHFNSIINHHEQKQLQGEKGNHVNIWVFKVNVNPVTLAKTIYHQAAKISLSNPLSILKSMGEIARGIVTIDAQQVVKKIPIVSKLYQKLDDFYFVRFRMGSLEKTLHTIAPEIAHYHNRFGNPTVPNKPETQGPVVAAARSLTSPKSSTKLHSVMGGMADPEAIVAFAQQTKELGRLTVQGATSAKDKATTWVLTHAPRFHPYQVQCSADNLSRYLAVAGTMSYGSANRLTTFNQTVNRFADAYQDDGALAYGTCRVIRDANNIVTSAVVPACEAIGWVTSLPTQFDHWAYSNWRNFASDGCYDVLGLPTQFERWANGNWRNFVSDGCYDVLGTNGGGLFNALVYGNLDQAAYHWIKLQGHTPEALDKIYVTRDAEKAQAFAQYAVQSQHNPTGDAIAALGQAVQSPGSNHVVLFLDGIEGIAPVAPSTQLTNQTELVKFGFLTPASGEAKVAAAAKKLESLAKKPTTGALSAER